MEAVPAVAAAVLKPAADPQPLVVAQASVRLEVVAR